jgi:hypothetical protein
LNLPAQLYSYGLRKLVAGESVRGSFEAAAAAVERATGVAIGKRQVEHLAQAAAVDIEAFYTARCPEPAKPDRLLVMGVRRQGHRDDPGRATRGHCKGRQAEPA